MSHSNSLGIPSPIPEIVITETPDMIPDEEEDPSSVECYPECESQPDSYYSTSAEDEVVTESGDVFSPARTCDDAPQRGGSVGVSLEATPSEDHFHRRGSCLGRSWLYYYRFSDCFVKSKFIVPLQLLLLALPISAGFMASRYMESCPMSLATPLIMFMMGIAGTVVLLCDILVILRTLLLPAHEDWWLLRVVVIFGNLMLVMLLCTEMMSFLRFTPSFEKGDENYCHPTFYAYTYWGNFATLLLVLVIFLVHLPSCTLESISTPTPFVHHAA